MNGDRMTKNREHISTDVDSLSQTKWDDLSNVSFSENTKNQYDLDIEEIYKEVENPLTTDSLKVIMSLYSDDSNNTIYRCLEKANVENKNYAKNTEDEVRFRESLYGDWLTSLKQMSKEEVQKAGMAFYVMGRYALSHPEVKTRQQLNDLVRPCV